MTLRCNPTDSVRITSPFGPRNFSGLEFHLGMDLGPIVPGKEGDNIYTVADGTVRVSQANAGNQATGYGYYVVVEHKDYCSLYAHLQKLEVRVGQKVKAGEVDSTGPHLHFEIRECAYNKFWEKGKSKGEYKYVIDTQPLLLKRAFYYSIFKNHKD